jgi:hypothetical protein
MLKHVYVSQVDPTAFTICLFLTDVDRMLLTSTSKLRQLAASHTSQPLHSSHHDD